jgi:glycosyltransferase involved in cell wall biosynthesis
MEALAAAGYDVTVICPRGPSQIHRETINGVKIHRFHLPIPTNGTKPINYVIEFLYATVAMTLLTLWVWMFHGLDVLHYYNPPDTLFLAGILPKLASKTIVYDLRDLAPELYQSKFEHRSSIIQKLLLWLEKLTCRQADHIIVVNESYRQIVLERDCVPLQHVTIVRQGPDPDRIRPAQPNLELSGRAKTIFAYLGAMAKQDGIDHLLRALHHLDQDFGYQDWYCVLIGEVEDQQGLQELADELRVGDRILFTGYQPIDHWVSILSAADICVEPAPSNPLNEVSTMNKLMDYMAMGKPSVAYDLREHRFTAGEAALYAKANDEADMARQFIRLINAPELRARLGEIGRQRIMEQLAWNYQKALLLSVYAGLAKMRSS